MDKQSGSDETRPPREIGEAVLQQVKDALESIEYGSVLLKVHQGEVVGIETSTKLRLRGSKD